MTNLSLDEAIAAEAIAAPADFPAQDALRDALLESRQRWRHMVALAADLAFETDAEGRFVFVMPEAALGWPGGSLIGQPSDLLMGSAPATPADNPFHPGRELRRHRANLRCADGSQVRMVISTTPLFDIAGRRIGARGVGIDISDADFQEPQVALRLRRGEILDQILMRISRETTIEAMMDAALWTLVHALGAEGGAIIGSLTANGPSVILHECGPGAASLRDLAIRTLDGDGPATPFRAPDGRWIAAATCPTRAGNAMGIALWRAAAARAFTPDEAELPGAAIGVVRIILEYEAVRQEMALQARTDPLTEVLNRRAFLEELGRHVSRLDRERSPGTVIFIDMDGFKAVNDRLGHAMGDKILVHVADRLRRLVRPNDLIARLGGDEFALWLSGADHLTAAERADHLCKTVPAELQSLLPEAIEGVGLSIGIATRSAGSREPVDEVIRRADAAMYEVKRSGRGHWRVALRDGE